MNQIPVAVQLYTLREELEKDFIGTIRRVAEIGYQGVEFAGLYGHSPVEVRALLDELGLKAVSAHVPLNDLRNNLQQVIEEQKILGSSYIICPYLLEHERTEETYLSLVDFLQNASEICENNGLTLGYHNHDFELVQLSNGKTALETLLDGAPSVIAEFDIFWLTKANETPVDWIEKYDQRTPIVHLKDMTMDEDRVFAELGTGGVDLEAVLAIGAKAGVKWWIVEQDQCKNDPFESIQTSYNYLKTKLPYLNK